MSMDLHKLPHVQLNPGVSFGEPTVRGISVAMIAKRFEEGESVQLLADDYCLGREWVEAALRFRLRFRDRRENLCEADEVIGQDPRFAEVKVELADGSP